MAQDYSFDIVSEVDLQVIDDVVNVATKEIQNRFDLKGQNCQIEFSRGEKTVTFTASSDFQVKQLKDIIASKMAKRDVSSKAFSVKKTEKASGGTIREIDAVVCGIDQPIAKEIVALIKKSGIKVQASIQDDKVRVSGKDKDDLQKVIQAVRAQDWTIALQFNNYR
jgi:hypothetical protein